MLSFTDVFKIGIGPSSSHTMGPMIAAKRFINDLLNDLPGGPPSRLVVTLLGSLAWTGRGHAADQAVVLGLAGLDPATCTADVARATMNSVTASSRIRVAPQVEIQFDPRRDVVFDRKSKASRHPNTLRFAAFDEFGAPLLIDTWCSVGGGFVLREAGLDEWGHPNASPQAYRSGGELLKLAQDRRCSIAEIVRLDEMTLKTEDELNAEIDIVAEAMFSCIERGLTTDGVLPGNLAVQRRAARLWTTLRMTDGSNHVSPTRAFDCVSAFAMAVNEENAAGGRVVTAPTNGASGVVPAVLRYYRDFCVGSTQDGIRILLLTASAIAILIKSNATISGAEVGCQGEVGTAAAMAAAGLAAALGGAPRQVENAAEIALEHHLGMTCDPIGGLVQIPCIERNAFGAIKAINAASLALMSDGVHRVSLDAAIETMRETGRDMKSKYRETSKGGLAKNVVC